MLFKNSYNNLGPLQNACRRKRMLDLPYIFFFVSRVAYTLNSLILTLLDTTFFCKQIHKITNLYCFGVMYSNTFNRFI